MVVLVPLEEFNCLAALLALVLIGLLAGAMAAAVAPVLAMAALVLVFLSAVGLLIQSARGRLTFRALFLYQIVFFGWAMIASYGSSSESVAYSSTGVAGGLIALVATGVAFGMVIGRLPRVPILALVLWPVWFLFILYELLAAPTRGSEDPLSRALVAALILVVPAILALLLTARRRSLDASSGGQ